MKITPEMFKSICTFDRITPRFLNVIIGLGRKTASMDENYMTCHHQLNPCLATDGTAMKHDDSVESSGQSTQHQYESLGLSSISCRFPI